MKKIVNTENAPKPLGPYSQAVEVNKLLFISGQLPIDPKEGKITTSGITGQTIQVMENIKAILQAAGYNFSDVVQTNVYLSSMVLFSDFNSVYAKYFDKAFPARATIGTQLVAGALIEISMVAYKK